VTEGVHKLGEVLRAAREAKGVDLARVERETKIRERYLSALERGDYRELPGAVYTKGFLRNYGAYLGLDPEYLIDLYRLETSVAAERQRVPGPPRPLARRGSRAFVITPGLVFAALLTVGVGALVAYIGWELVNFARTPELRITDPPGPVDDYTDTTMTIRGVTAPNARVMVSNLTENPTVQADDDGEFAVTVELMPGSNVVRLTAHDPVTNRESETVERTIIVVADVAASATPDAPSVVLTEPAADATISGPVAIAGTAAPGTQLELTASLVSPAPPSFTITDLAGATGPVEPGPPAAPDAITVTADAAGAFAATLDLSPGTWEVGVTPDGGEVVARRVVVEPPGDLTGTITVDGGDSYLEVDQDGEPIPNVSGTVVTEGTSIELAATGNLRVRAGNAGAVQLTLNGLTIGAMGGGGQVVEWRITPAGG